MNTTDRARIILDVAAVPPSALRVRWSDGVDVDLDISEMLEDRAFSRVRTSAEFARASVGEWGHSVEWPSGCALGADRLWLETLSATGRGDTRDFLEWRLRHGLSLSAASAALGLARRTIAYYSNGDRRIPRTVLLACRGWEAMRQAA